MASSLPSIFAVTLRWLLAITASSFKTASASSRVSMALATTLILVLLIFVLVDSLIS
jgi:hypothetical protein